MELSKETFTQDNSPATTYWGLGTVVLGFCCVCFFFSSKPIQWEYALTLFPLFIKKNSEL